MKIGIILLSMLAAGGTWWWRVHRPRRAAAPAFAQQLKDVLKSLMAGVVVYFVLMAVALLYLTMSTA